MSANPPPRSSARSSSRNVISPSPRTMKSTTRLVGVRREAGIVAADDDRRRRTLRAGCARSGAARCGAGTSSPTARPRRAGARRAGDPRWRRRAPAPGSGRRRRPGAADRRCRQSRSGPRSACARRPAPCARTSRASRAAARSCATSGRRHATPNDAGWRTEREVTASVARLDRKEKVGRMPRLTRAACLAMALCGAVGIVRPAEASWS